MHVFNSHLLVKISLGLDCVCVCVCPALCPPAYGLSIHTDSQRIKDDDKLFFILFALPR